MQPQRTPQFESSQKGLYVVGDIANAPTIRYTFWEGIQLRPMQNKISIFLVREQNLFPFSIIDVVT